MMSTIVYIIGNTTHIFLLVSAHIHHYIHLLAPLAEPPESVSSLRVTGITEDSVTVEWGEPTSDGGDVITGYLVEKRESRSQYWSAVTTVSARTTTCVIRHLHRTSKYHIRVAAQNVEGKGAFRELPDAIIPMKPKSKWFTTSSSSSIYKTIVRKDR